MAPKIRAARDEDVPVMAAITAGSFAEYPFSKAMYPEHLRVKPGVEDQVEWTIDRTRKGLEDPSTHHLVSTDADAEGREIITGAAEWCAPKADDVEAPKKSPEEQAKDVEERLAKLPSFIDRETVLKGREEISQLLKESEPAFEGKSKSKMWTLNSIAVAPSSRGQGIGRMLTLWGIVAAEKNGEDIWLIAAPPGKNMYLSVGFKIVGEGRRCGEPQYAMTKFFEDN